MMRAAGGDRSLDGLIGEIYDAAMEPDRWPAVLAQLGERLESEALYLSMLELPRRAESAGNLRYDPGAAAADCHAGRRARRDLEHALVLRCPDTRKAFGVLRLASRSGSFDAGRLGLAAALARHMQQAVRLFLRFGALRAERDAAVKALDCVQSGVVLVDPAGRALLVNRAAEAMLAAADGVGLSRGRLHAASAPQSAALRRLIAGAAATGDGRGLSAGGALALDRPSGRRRLSVRVGPLRLDLPGHPRAVVLLGDPELTLEPAETVLMRLYGLTVREAAVAARLTGGREVGEIAAALRISANTVRAHLKNAYAKTGTRGQADLVRLLLRSPAGLAPDRR